MKTPNVILLLSALFTLAHAAPIFSEAVKQMSNRRGTPLLPWLHHGGEGTIRQKSGSESSTLASQNKVGVQGEDMALWIRMLSTFFQNYVRFERNYGILNSTLNDGVAKEVNSIIDNLKIYNDTLNIIKFTIEIFAKIVGTEAVTRAIVDYGEDILKYLFRYKQSDLLNREMHNTFLLKEFVIKGQTTEEIRTELEHFLHVVLHNVEDFLQKLPIEGADAQDRCIMELLRKTFAFFSDLIELDSFEVEYTPWQECKQFL
jgi:hypothetical protein